MSRTFKRNQPIEFIGRRKPKKRQNKRFADRKVRRHKTMQKASTALAKAHETIKQQQDYIALLQARVVELTTAKAAHKLLKVA